VIYSFNTVLDVVVECLRRSQGLTLVHFSAQRQRFLWDRGCNQ